MSFAPSPCCTGGAQETQQQQGITSSLSNLLRAIFCCGADKAESLENHADKAGSGSSESESPGDFLPEGSLTEAAEEQGKAEGQSTGDAGNPDEPLDPEHAKRLAAKWVGDFVVGELS